MALETTINRASFSGNGTTDDFSFPYYFLDEDDLVVILRDADDVETVQTITTHYTVAGAGDPAGGTVTMITPPATGETLVIYRDPAITQTLDLVENDIGSAEAKEVAYDRLTMIAQRLRDMSDRTVRLAETDDSATLTLPLAAERANQFLAFDDDGNPIAASAVDGASVPVSAYMATVLDETTPASARTELGFSGAGGTVAPANIEDLAVTEPKLAQAVFSALTAVAAAVDDYVAIADASDSGNKKKALVSSIKNLAYRSVATTDSSTAADGVLILSGASFTLTLHTAVGNTGQVIDILHNGTSLTQLYTLATTSSQTIGGIASGAYVLYTNGERLRLVSDGTNWQILNHFAETDYANYTPSNTQGFGTITGINLMWRRSGKDLILKGSFTTGTVTGSEAQLELPGSSVISFLSSTVEFVGSYFLNTSTTSLLFVQATNADTFLNFGIVTNAGSNPFTTLVGSSAAGSTQLLSINATIPISGWRP